MISLRSAAALSISVLITASLAGQVALAEPLWGVRAQESEKKKLPRIPEPEASAAQVPKGYRVEVVVKGLTYPTSVDFDGRGGLYIAEGGYSYGDPIAPARILHVSPRGEIRVAADQLSGPVTDILWHRGRLYISQRGKISAMDTSGKISDLVTGLPSEGDHHNNQLTVGLDGKLYFGQGTATNSGVVGVDNYKMGWLEKHPQFHDQPAKEIRLRGGEYETPNPLTLKKAETVKTSAFHPFTKNAPDPATVPGVTKASGTILRMNTDGSNLEVYAWGLRNPFGVMWGPDKKLYATENGFDVRGSRPIANDWDDLYEIKQGAWYGWPDYAAGIPVTDPRFATKDGPPIRFLMAEHPPVEKPLLTFPKHSAVTKIDFSPGGRFGHKGHMFVSFWGHMAPMTGTVEEHGGHRVVRIDPVTKKTETFFTQKEHGHSGSGHEGGSNTGNTGNTGNGHEGSGNHQGESGGHGSGDGGGGEQATPGPRRLTDVRFSPQGDALYVVDFGALTMTDAGPHPFPGTGLIWRITRDGSPKMTPPAGLSAQRPGGLRTEAKAPARGTRK